MPRPASCERIEAHLEYLKATRLIERSGKKLVGYDVPDGVPHRSPEELAGSRIPRGNGRLTALQRETVVDRLAHLEELLRFTKVNPGHPKSLGHTERDREAAVAGLEQEIAKTRTRLETS